MLERIADWRLVLPAGGAWLTAWLATELPGVARWLALGCAITAVLAAVLAAAFAPAFAAAFTPPLAARQQHRRMLLGTASLILSACAIPAGVAMVQVETRIPPAVETVLDDGTRAELRFVLTGLTKPSSFGHRLPAELTAVDGHPVSAPVLVFAELSSKAPGIGEEFVVTASLKPTSPGDDVVGMAFARDVPEQVSPAHPVLDVGNQLRQSFIELATRLPDPGAMLVPGLSVGDEALVDDALGDAMKVSSLSHLTAVSGSNIAIVVAGIVALGRVLGWSRPVRIAAAGFALAGFVLLVTPQGSVIRAGAMAVIVLVLEAISRPVAGIPVLALAVIGLLTYDPWLSHNYGFALSTAATAGLLFGTRPAATFFERWLPRPLALLVSVPLVAQLACQPILLMLEPSIPVYGVIANLLAAPAAPIATVIGLFACLVGYVFAPLGLALAWIAWLPAQWIGLIALTVDALPGAALPWFDGVVGVLTWLALCVAVLVLVGRIGSRRLRRVICFAVAIALVLVGTKQVTDGLIRARDLPEHWRAVACDVGQGDALLVRGGGATVLIDTGEHADLLHACLAEFGIDRIDLLILSHFDRDHAGALAELATPVGAAWLPDTAEARAELATARLMAADIPIHFGARGDVLTLGDLRWSVLSPERSDDGGPGSATGNDSSLTVLAEPTTACRASCLSLLALGDLGENAQRPLLEQRVEADIVKVSHHGSRDQLPELYRQIRAGLALISVGEGNGYGHPTDDLLDLLAHAGTPWLRTDTGGHLAVFVRDSALAAWTSKRT